MKNKKIVCLKLMLYIFTSVFFISCSGSSSGGGGGETPKCLELSDTNKQEEVKYQFAESGCCSSPGGVKIPEQVNSTGFLICNDNTPSPTCKGSSSTPSNCSCTKQDPSSNRIIVSCFTKRSQYSADCTRSTTNGAESGSEVCLLGFDNDCSTGSINPQAIKVNVDNGSLVLIAKDTGLKLNFTTVTESLSGESYIILKQEGDVGLTYSGSLPDCRTLGIGSF